MHDAFKTEPMKNAEEARKVASQKQREMLGAFTEVQFAMYAAHQNDFNPYHMRKLERVAETFSEALAELRDAEDHVAVAISASENVRSSSRTSVW